MANLSFIEKQTICRLFGINNGFVFKSWNDKGEYNKTTTKDLIEEACGINIFDDEGYKDLSQQKCIQKIWDEESPQTVANLLKALSEYFCFQMGNSYWGDEDENDYQQVKRIIERLESETTVVLPKQTESQNLQLLLEDIETNLQNDKPELIVDRLHTFSTEFMRSICRKHNLGTTDNQNNELPLQSLVGRLKKWYSENHYFDSEFSVVAIQNTINIFDKYNNIRNDHSAAHPNEMLNKAEAMYAVHIVAETLTFIDKIERIKDAEAATPCLHRDDLDTDGELPF